MVNVTQLKHWQKKRVELVVISPVPISEMEALNDGHPVIDEALRMYMYLLLLRKQGYSLKMLDSGMNEVSDFELFQGMSLADTSRHKTKFTLSLGWRSQQNLDKMREMSGTESLDELVSKALHVLWATHKHMEQDGFMLLKKSGEVPQVISAEDFYE